MKYGFDEKKLEPKMSLEEKDIADAFQIKAMMQHPGWEILQKYLESSHLEFLQMENKWVLDVEKEKLVNTLVAKRSGFDFAGDVAMLVIKRADLYLERQKENTGGDLDEAA